MKTIPTPTEPNALYIEEIFKSIQGEGVNVGMPAIFIRLAGCSMGCPFCDTKPSWEQTSEKLMSHEAILAKVDELESDNIVITGGEPFEQDIKRLVFDLQDLGHDIYIETNGSIDLPLWVHNVFVTMSPKSYESIPENNWAKVDELKFVIQSPEDVNNIWTIINREDVYENMPISLQPEGNRKECIDVCVKALMNTDRFRLSVQLHKLLELR